MAGKNTEVKIISTKQIFPDIRGIADTATNWNQGDILIFNGTVVRAATAEAEAGTQCIGIAQQNAASGIPIGPYAGLATAAAAGVQALNGPVYGNTFNMVLKTSETIAPGAYVYAYPTGGANYVAATASSTATAPVGVYVGHVTVTTAAAGTQIECLIGAQFPNSILKF